MLKFNQYRGRHKIKLTNVIVLGIMHPFTFAIGGIGIRKDSLTPVSVLAR